MAIRRVTVEEVELRVKGVEKVKKGYDKIDKAQDKLAASSRRTAGAMGRMMQGAGRMGMSFGQAATAAAGFAASLLVVQKAISALKAPVSLAIDFEKNFAQIKTLSKDVNESVRQDLLALAANLPSSASDVTKAAYQAISAGVQVSDVVPFLAEASKVAVGGATSLTSAVDLLTSATNAFRNQNLTAADAADSFFTAVKEGKTTIEEINAVFGRGAAMAQFGVSIDEMNAALAALTKQGMPTAEAMTRLQALVKTIANPVGQVAKGFKALGFEAGVSRLQNEGLIAVLSDLQEKTMGSTEILGTLTRRQEANSAALGLLGNNYQETIETFEAFSEKSGAAAAANDIMADTVSGLINRFSALKEDVLRRMGEEVLPLVNEALESSCQYSGQRSEDRDGLWQVYHREQGCDCSRNQGNVCCRRCADIHLDGRCCWHCICGRYDDARSDRRICFHGHTWRHTVGSGSRRADARCHGWHRRCARQHAWRLRRCSSISKARRVNHPNQGSHCIS
jgi:TP901 family phage tail tape measure protein